MLLTEQEISQEAATVCSINHGVLTSLSVAYIFARAIEAKVIEKIKAQGPVAWLSGEFVTTDMNKAEQWLHNGYEVQPLHVL